jgi:hypothetical protein
MASFFERWNPFGGAKREENAFNNNLVAGADLNIGLLKNPETASKRSRSSRTSDYTRLKNKSPRESFEKFYQDVFDILTDRNKPNAKKYSDVVSLRKSYNKVLDYGVPILDPASREARSNLLKVAINNLKLSTENMEKILPKSTLDALAGGEKKAVEAGFTNTKIYQAFSALSAIKMGISGATTVAEKLKSIPRLQAAYNYIAPAAVALSAVSATALLAGVSTVGVVATVGYIGYKAGQKESMTSALQMAVKNAPFVEIQSAQLIIVEMSGWGYTTTEIREGQNIQVLKRANDLLVKTAESAVDFASKLPAAQSVTLRPRAEEYLALVKSLRETMTERYPFGDRGPTETKEQADERKAEFTRYSEFATASTLRGSRTLRYTGDKEYFRCSSLDDMPIDKERQLRELLMSLGQKVTVGTPKAELCRIFNGLKGTGAGNVEAFAFLTPSFASCKCVNPIEIFAKAYFGTTVKIVDIPKFSGSVPMLVTFTLPDFIRNLNPGDGRGVCIYKPFVKAAALDILTFTVGKDRNGYPVPQNITLVNPDKRAELGRLLLLYIFGINNEDTLNSYANITQLRNEIRKDLAKINVPRATIDEYANGNYAKIALAVGGLFINANRKLIIQIIGAPEAPSPFDGAPGTLTDSERAAKKKDLALAGYLGGPPAFTGGQCSAEPQAVERGFGGQFAARAVSPRRAKSKRSPRRSTSKRSPQRATPKRSPQRATPKRSP